MLESPGVGVERWPEVELDLLDRQPIVDSETIAGLCGVRLAGAPRIADVLDWADAPSSERWDIVVANLFLHHFDADDLRRLLAGCARAPMRSPPASRGAAASRSAPRT